MIQAVHHLVRTFLAQKGEPEHVAACFCALISLQFESSAGDSLLSSAVQRMWTSTLEYAPSKGSLCHIINAAIRSDDDDLMQSLTVLARSIHQLCSISPAPGLPHFPTKCFRGSSLPAEHHAFFTVGRRYRVPGYLATSLSDDIAREFLGRAHSNGAQPAVLWRVHLDPRGAHDIRFQCLHVSFIPPTRSHVPVEAECLFSP